MKMRKTHSISSFVLAVTAIMLSALVMSAVCEQVKPYATPTEMPIQEQMNLYKETGSYTGVKTWNDGEIDAGVFRKDVSPQDVSPKDANP